MTCGLLVKKLRLKKSTSTNYLPTPRKRQVNPKQSNYTLPRGPHTQRFLPVWRQTEKLSSTHEPHEHELVSRNCNFFIFKSLKEVVWLELGSTLGLQAQGGAWTLMRGGITMTATQYGDSSVARAQREFPSTPPAFSLVGNYYLTCSIKKKMLPAILIFSLA